MESEAMTEPFEAFKSIVKHPEVFVMPNNDKSQKIKSKLLETMYNFSKKVEESRKSKSLPKLITEGMDDESLWQQLELQNSEVVQFSLKDISSFLSVTSDTFQLNMKSMKAKQLAENGDGSEEDSGEEQDESQGSNDEDDVEDEGDSNEDEENEQGSEDETEEQMPAERGRKKIGKTIVDDEFFKLREMEEFLKQEDRREMDPGLESDSESVNMFTNDETNLEESMRYHDFYDNPGNYEEVEDEEIDEEEELEKPEGPKSSYEMTQERLHKKIEHMESSMMDDKPWQMKGEVKAVNRPQNSLLEEVLEFESTTRPAPIITEEVSIKLEDIIRQRIKDKAFDDVERKVKPSDIQIEYKKQLVLDQEKSKQSLAQLYEKDFLKELDKKDPNADDEEPEEPKEHKEIRAELKDLFDKLDLLSNFYYTPRAAQPDLKIITNLPTISMEEVAPVSVSDAAMLAPEEIKRKPKGDVFGAGERTKTDKNRERRHKKVHQKKKFEKQTLGTKGLTEKVIKSRNVEKMKTGDTTKSSSAFFSKLQDDMAMSKNGTAPAKKRKLEKQNHQAKKLKL